VTFAIASQETEDVRVTDCPFFTMGSSNSGDFTAKNMWEEIKKVLFTAYAQPSTRVSIHPVRSQLAPMFSEHVIF
jgi:hypothetical protein